MIAGSLTCAGEPICTMGPFAVLEIGKDASVRARSVQLHSMEKIMRAAYVNQFRQRWSMGGILIVDTALHPRIVADRLCEALYEGLPAAMCGALLKGEIFEQWNDPQPPIRLIGGVGRTIPDPF